MSSLFRLNLQDLLKGLVVTVLSAVIGTVLEALRAGQIDWRNVALIAITTGLSYILKQLATDSDGKILGKL